MLSRRKFNVRFFLAVCLLFPLVASPLFAQQIDTNDATTIANVVTIPTFAVVPQATSKLTRTDEGMFLQISTKRLGDEYAYSVWWFIFKDFCSLCIPGVNPMTVINATGRVSDRWGQADFAASLTAAQITGASMGDTNPTIHAIVRSHGKAKTLRAQGVLEFALSNVGGGCDITAENVCANVQAVAHERIP